MELSTLKIEIIPDINYNMVQDIIGRKQEIQQLEKLIQSDKPEFLVVYGRKRVGKSI